MPAPYRRGDMTTADLSFTNDPRTHRSVPASLRSRSAEERYAEVAEIVRRLGPWATAARLKHGFNTDEEA